MQDSRAGCLLKHELRNAAHVLMGLREIAGREGPDTVPLAGGRRIKDPVVKALLVGKTLAARTGGVRLEIDEGSALGSASELSGDIVIVLGNLVDNAVDAALEGPDLEPAVWVTVRENAGGVLLRVEDNGPGIPPDKRQWIFNTGASTKQRADGPDRGLGLAIVRKITAKRGGTVAVLDRAGGGAVVTGRLATAE